ncbi:MAG: right-handed parallel beta-helix repeat-containing protein [Candidatus Thermoplasmatota archaeon]
MKKYKKCFFSTFNALILVFIVFSCVCSSNIVSPQSFADNSPITVDDDGDGDFQNIQKAIDLANSGDVIKVYSGRYTEDVLISKPLSLIGVEKELGEGNDTGKPLLVGDRMAIHIFHTHTVEVSNFSIQDSRFGIAINCSSNCTIKGNYISNNKDGIFRLGKFSDIIWGRKIVDITLKENHIINNGMGIGAVFTFSGLIEGNNIAYNKQGGLAAMFSGNILVKENNFIENGKSCGSYSVTQAMSFLSSSSFSHNFWSDWQKDTPREIPLFKKDRNPADEPYDIPV